jgi:hypothetical protein
MTQRTRLCVIAAVTVATVTGVFALPPLPQSQAYHNFADRRALFGIPNFLNVASNAAFLLAGILGLSWLSRRHHSALHNAFIEQGERWPYAALFLGIALTGLGSGYYHLAPDNARLVWDRLPMAIAFTAILSATISDRIGVQAGLSSLVPLAVVGMGSVVYWHVTELLGRGDLRAYVLVQFYPMLAIPLIMLLFPPRYTRSADLLGAAALYGLAKVCEVLDARIFAAVPIVGGHTLKHLAAALAAYQILRMLQKRQPLAARATPQPRPPGTGFSTTSPPR